MRQPKKKMLYLLRGRGWKKFILVVRRVRSRDNHVYFIMNYYVSDPVQKPSWIRRKFSSLKSFFISYIITKVKVSH